MKIRYRSKFTGTFIKATDAGLKKFAKAVVSELVDPRTKTVIGKALGYFTQPKKLARAAMPAMAITRSTRRYEPPPLEVPDDDTDDIEQWEEYSDDYPALDALDEIGELDDEDEWYEEA